MKRTSIKHPIAATLFAGTASAVLARTAAVAAASAPGQAAVLASERFSATVDSIDQTTRRITTREADDTRLSFTAGPDLRNLAQVNVGDQVEATFIDAVAVAVEHPPRSK
jgi:hypothetical protein